MAISNMVIPTTAPLSSMSSMGGIFGRTMDVANNVPPLVSNSGSGSGLSSLGSSLLSGGLGAAGGLLSGLISNIFAARAMKRQFKYNTQLMNMQNALQRDMIEDDAMLKLQGYKKAGLSTASLGGSFGNAASVPSQSVGTASGSMPDLRLGDIFNAARQVRMQEKALQSEIDLNEANAEAARANARNSISSSRLTDVETLLKNTYGATFYEKQFAGMDAETKDRIASALERDQNRVNSIRMTDAQIKLMEQQFDLNYKNFNIMEQEALSRIYKNKADGALSYQEAKESVERVKKLAQEREALKLKYKLDSETFDTVVQTMKIQLTGLELSNDINALPALRNEWATRLMRQTGYDAWVAKQIADGILDYVERGIQIADQGVTLYGNVVTQGQARNLTGGSTTTTTHYNAKGNVVKSTKTQYSPIVRNK